MASTPVSVRPMLEGTVDAVEDVMNDRARLISWIVAAIVFLAMLVFVNWFVWGGWHSSTPWVSYP